MSKAPNLNKLFQFIEKYKKMWTFKFTVKKIIDSVLDKYKKYMINIYDLVIE